MKYTFLLSHRANTWTPSEPCNARTFVWTAAR